MNQPLRELLFDSKKPLIHRDLSWLQFNDRVLNEARDIRNPLLERLRYLGITASNLDEFWMIRIASIRREIVQTRRKKGKNSRRLDRLQSIRQAILSSIIRFNRSQTQTFDALVPLLTAEGIVIERTLKQGTSAYRAARDMFEKHVRPHLEKPRPCSPKELRKLDNLSLALVFPGNVLVPIGSQVPPYLISKLTRRSVQVFCVDEVLMAFAGLALQRRGSPLVLRVTRDSDVQLVLSEEDSEAFPSMIEKRVGERSLRKAVRLQYKGEVQGGLLERLVHTFRLENQQVQRVAHPILLHSMFGFVNQISVHRRNDIQLLFPGFKARVPKRLRQGEDVFSHLQRRDYLLHHPYDSFDGYVNFLEAAVSDPKVESIQQTVYRVDALSRAVDLLKQAARSKKVRILIEPRARFDEINNIRLARELREAGVKVVFSSGALKMHAKIAVVTRREERQLRTYTHLSTGNYNAKTARQYEDFAIITAHPGIGADALEFMNAASAGRIPSSMRHLVLAPKDLHRRLSLLIKQETVAAEAGMPARIFAKVNALVDEKLIYSLYAASQAGVAIDLIVRGACSLIPREPGLSENIRVFSVVDRFLEHSRMYYFESTNTMFLSSADWMPRNFYSRLEIAFPVLDPRIYAFLSEVAIPLYLDDRIKARVLTKDGQWRARRRTPSAIQAQREFEALKDRNYRGTPLD